MKLRSRYLLGITGLGKMKRLVEGCTLRTGRVRMLSLVRLVRRRKVCRWLGGYCRCAVTAIIKDWRQLGLLGAGYRYQRWRQLLQWNAGLAGEIAEPQTHGWIRTLRCWFRTRGWDGGGIVGRRWTHCGVTHQRSWRRARSWFRTQSVEIVERRWTHGGGTDDCGWRRPFLCVAINGTNSRNISNVKMKPKLENITKNTCWT